MSALTTKYISLFWKVRRFIFIGIINTIFGYLMYVAGVKLFNMDYTAALVFSYILGVTFSYITFRTFVFEDHGTKKQSFPKFILTYIAIFIFNWWALYFLISILMWNKLWAQILMVPCCAVLSFIINNIFVFRKKNNQE